MFCDIHTESGISTFMMEKLCSVYKHICRHGCSVKLQISLSVLIHLRFFECAGIFTGSTVVIVSTVLPVLCVPGVRKRYVFSFPTVRVFIKNPVFIQYCRLSHFCHSSCISCLCSDFFILCLFHLINHFFHFCLFFLLNALLYFFHFFF